MFKAIRDFFRRVWHWVADVINTMAIGMDICMPAFQVAIGIMLMTLGVQMYFFLGLLLIAVGVVCLMLQTVPRMILYSFQLLKDYRLLPFYTVILYRV